MTSQDNVPHHGWNRTSGIEKRTFRISRCHGCLMTLWNTWVYTWYPKQPVLDGCLVKQPFLCNMIWNHPIETTIYKWMFQVPGSIHPDWYTCYSWKTLLYNDRWSIYTQYTCMWQWYFYIHKCHKKSTVHVSNIYRSSHGWYGYIYTSMKGYQTLITDRGRPNLMMSLWGTVTLVRHSYICIYTCVFLLIFIQYVCMNRITP